MNDNTIVPNDKPFLPALIARLSCRAPNDNPPISTRLHACVVAVWAPLLVGDVSPQKIKLL